MIVEKLTEEDLALYEVIRNPVWCGEFLEELDSEEEEFSYEYTLYQKEMLLDFSTQVSIIAGRAVGKTVSLITKIVWYALNNYFDTILFTVPNRSHLDPVFLGLQRKFRYSKFLKYWIGRNSVNSQAFIIKFLNNFMLMCRIAGTSGTGVNVVGLHVPVILLDESAYYPWGTWLELTQVMNDWQEGHQLVVSGVPDGRREKSVLYQCDVGKSYSKHRVSAYKNPRFTGETEQRALEKFGGKDSQDFLRQVLGEHGTPTYALFDRANMRIEDYFSPVVKVYGAQVKTDPSKLTRIIMNMPTPPRYADMAVAGIDLGYTEPTAIVVLYRRESVWYQLFRLELHQITYDLQEKFISDLDEKYGFNYIGFDAGAGGQGKSLHHNLVNKEEYSTREFPERLLPVEFGGTVVVGFDDEGEELKERVKPFSAAQFQQMVNSFEFAFSSRDMDLIVELERITYHKTPAGNVVYKSMTPGGSDRGADHNFSALLTFAMVVFEKLGQTIRRNEQVKLIRSRWLKP